MKKTRRQKTAMIVAIILAMLLVLPLVLSGIVGSSSASAAVTQNDIKKLKDKQTALETEKKRIQESINQLKKDRADAMKQKKAVDQQIDILNQEIDNITQLTQTLIECIADKQAALDEAIKNEDETYELFRTRVRVMEEMGEATYLGILFKSTSFTDLLGRWELVNEIVAADKELMSSLSEQRAAIEADKLQLEEDKAELIDTRKAMSERQSELADQSMEASELISGLVDDIEEFSKAYSEFEAAIEEESKAIAKAQAEWKKQQEQAKKSTAFVGGPYSWPVPASHNVTSGYGNRTHPILKVKKFHTGIDVAAPKGTKIVAANAGTVIIATYNSGYGNYIVIDHGGGQATLYAHQSKFASGIKVGSEVKAGQLIGYVGSTGLSTGPHLHFEVRINNEHVNPGPYVGYNG